MHNARFFVRAVKSCVCGGPRAARAICPGRNDARPARAPPMYSEMPGGPRAMWQNIEHKGVQDNTRDLANSFGNRVTAPLGPTHKLKPGNTKGLSQTGLLTWG